MAMASSSVAGDDADPTKTPSRGPVLDDTPPRLRFTVGLDPQEFPLEDAPGFISSIDAALARNANDYEQVEVDSLEISLVFRPFELYTDPAKYATEHPHAALITADHVRGWLRYGMSRAAESFILELPPCPLAESEAEGMALDLPDSAEAVTMELTLGNATLTLPAAPHDYSFHSLTDLLLGSARIVDGDRLGNLLSYRASPCLTRLRLEYLLGVTELDLDVIMLEELTIVGARDLRCLKVDASHLRTLCVTDHNSLESESVQPIESDEGQLVIYAPRLEALTCSSMCKFRGLRFEAPSVREIGKLPLWTHGPWESYKVGRNEASIWILKHCALAHRLHLNLQVPHFRRELVDYVSILEEEIPELPNITALTVTISTWSGHSYAASLARLIAQCVNLEELHIHVEGYLKPPCSDQGCVCNYEGGWENENFSLERLRYMDITGVQGLDYEKRLFQMILEGAPAIEKFKLPVMDHGCSNLLSANSRGRWITCGDDGVYTWAPN